MNDRVLKSLIDIQFAIEEIEFFFVNKEKRFEEYSKDILLKRAIERDLEIIGEAMNRIFKEDSNVEITNAKRIIGLRNQIIHGYDSISDENIWGIVIIHLPKLKQEIEKLIQK